MWQVLFAAAVAGSAGFVAKHFLDSNAPNQPQNNEKSEEQQESIVASAFDSPVVQSDCNETGYEGKQEGIFRFSSSGSTGKKTCKKFRISRRRRFKNNSVPAKCGSSSFSSKDNSLFSWGLGVGIMYMMSAGKAEITKLSTAMDETSKIVHELRTELYKRKSKRVAESWSNIVVEQAQPMITGSNISGKDCNDAKVSELSLIDDTECSSSVLTEEAETEVPEMDHLVAELELELQKLPCSNAEAPVWEVTRPNLAEAEKSSHGFHDPEGHNVVAYQCHGVLPSELDQRLCHLLIEQQENQLGELESELYLAQSKLREKEAELQALKDCVRRLTEISLSSVSDNEAELGGSEPLKGMRTAA